MKQIEAAQPITNRAQRLSTWEKCWKAYDVPYYFGQVIRLNQKLYDAPGFELEFLGDLRAELYERYVEDELHEFGCGAGHNLEPLRGRKLKGYDWTESGCQHVRARGFEAERFDMFNPHKVGLKGAVLTVHALEQLGTDFKPFLDFLVAEKPDVCIHIEPIEEFYEDTLLDHLALQYHRKRGYLSGFMNAIPGKILQAYRTYVGGLMHEAYSVVVWKP